MQSTNWIANIMCQAEFGREALKGRQMDGYVQVLELFPEFSMTLATESQYKALHIIPVEHRMLHMDATGKLVNIAAYMQDYKQIYTYGIIAKDMRKISESNSKYLLVTETSTSQHDTEQISKIFLSLFPNEKKIGSILVIDYSWPTIHAALDQLNNETIFEYMDRVFELAKGDQIRNNENKMFLASCASHTMHRFVLGLKKKKIFSESDSRNFAVYCFSLMINCINLDQISKMFELICICFLNQCNSLDCQRAREGLQKLIDERRDLIKDADEKIREIFNDAVIEKDENDEEKDFEISEGLMLIAEKNDSKNRIVPTKTTKTIKGESKFGKCFSEIHQKVLINLKNMASSEINPLHSDDFVNFLQNQFMPYAGIWAGFIFKGTLKLKVNF